MMGITAEHSGDLMKNTARGSGTSLGVRSTLDRSTLAFMPYGFADLSGLRPLGFCGERVDGGGALYLLGNGHRGYSATLMRFSSPDNASPFSDGGVNAYAYVLGDPINLSDPDGRAARKMWIHNGRDYRPFNQLKRIVDFSDDSNFGIYHSNMSLFRKRKLLVYTHGRPGELRIDGGAMGPQGFIDWLGSKDINLSRYRKVTFIACLSGYSDSNHQAFAQTFSNITKIPSRGLDGVGYAYAQPRGKRRGRIGLLAKNFEGRQLSEYQSRFPLAFDTKNFAPQKNASVRSDD